MNKLKTFFESASIAGKAALAGLALAVVFGVFQIAFFLLNLASTIGNLVGYLLLIFILAFTINTIVEIGKYYSDKIN